MKQADKIEVNPEILAGKPIIKGTRVPVTLVLNLLARGYTPARIIKAYPNLTPADIKAAVAYSTARLNREMILPNLASVYGH